MSKVTRNLLVDGMLASVVLAAIGFGLAAVVVTDDAGIRDAVSEIGESDRIRGRRMEGSDNAYH